MNLDSLLGDAERGGDLLVWLARHHEPQYLAFTGRQSVEPLLQPRTLGALGSSLTTAAEGPLYAIQQLVATAPPFMARTLVGISP